MRRTRLLAAATALAAALTLGTTAAPAGAATAPIRPVAHVDLTRYIGAWRQIADIPQPYEFACLKDVTAHYSLNADGTVRVDNTCSGPFGFPIESIGGAKALDASDAVLEVSFLGIPGYQYYSGSANYVIIGLAADYSWAVVGAPDHGSAYVLSRTPTLTATARTAVVAALTASGYDPCSLTVTRQTGGATSSGPAC